MKEAILATSISGHLLVRYTAGEDMRRFVALTWGKRCLAGKATMHSLPHKGLRGRVIVPATRDNQADWDICIGGAMIYGAYMPQFGRIFLSQFDGVHDTIPLDPIPDDFKVVHRAKCTDHTFMIMERK